MGEIYIVTNKINGMRYVGQTKYTVEERWKQHLQECKLRVVKPSYFHNAIIKYGEECFEVKRVMHNIPIDKLDELETLCIKRYNTFRPNGYNLTLGGGGVKNYKHSRVTKAIIRQKLSHPRSEEDIQKIKEGQKRNNCFEKRSKNIEWRKAISKSRMGRFRGKNNPFGGKHHTQETKDRISNANSKSVLMCDLQGNPMRRFKSLKEARDYLISNNITSNETCQTPISKCCRGVEDRKTCYGFIWKYEKV